MRSTLLTISLLALCACTSTAFIAPHDVRMTQAEAEAAAQTAADAAARATRPDDNLNAVLWMQDSAEYGAVTTTIYRAAADKLDAALKEKKWDALVPGERDNAGKTARLKPAIIMDVDETVLDNSPYQARLIVEGKEFNDASWDLWVAEKQARAIPGVVDFARTAAAKGVTIFYLSNRAVHLKAATMANLKAVGMPLAHDDVFLGLGTVVAGCEQHGSEKDCRRRLIGRDYRVLMQFGDQLGDFVRIPANTRQVRAGLVATHRDWFGARWWMLPNPSYGSWEPAVFDNDWKQSREARRELKREALDIAK